MGLLKELGLRENCILIFRKILLILYFIKSKTGKTKEKHKFKDMLMLHLILENNIN